MNAARGSPLASTILKGPEYDPAILPPMLAGPDMEAIGEAVYRRIFSDEPNSTQLELDLFEAMATAFSFPVALGTLVMCKEAGETMRDVLVEIMRGMGVVEFMNQHAKQSRH